MTLHLVGNDGAWEIPWTGRLLDFFLVPKVPKFDGIYSPQTLTPSQPQFQTRKFQLVSIRDDKQFAIYIEVEDK